ncbi:MAG: adenosylcobalamin-dependent ribonucleoside-diphosphate reductase [Nitrospirae bacterium]|nr:adenosylcobalamin-dependent ribonucleoside-diphosphate reductase [Nitrospirota bacterium]
MQLTENAIRVLKTRYLLKDEQGNIIETPEELFRRVARTASEPEVLYGGNPREWEERFYELMNNLLFLPNTPMLINAGKEIGQLAACFVLPVDDSMKSIFDSLKNAALILQSGGGTGFSFSRLRPRADLVKSTGGIASGPVSFMRIYNTATEVIKQGGARRGANMGILRIDHPDIIEFIKIKRDEKELTNFNISVAVTDAFMEALKKNTEYDLINPRNNRVTGQLNARDVFKEIVESAWETGDPGLIFIDRINRDNPTPHIGEIESTNPCGEQPLLSFEACVLGSINLSRMVKPDTRFKIQDSSKKNEPSLSAQNTEHRTQINPPSPPFAKGGMGGFSYEIDWELLASVVKISVRFLDNVIDANNYPVPEIEKMHKGNRKIGLGVMGWADILIKLGIRYNSKKAFNLARQAMKFIRDNAREASLGLARERGTFPNFKGSIYDTPEFNAKGGLRNATTTTIAPTGTLSIIAGCSSGIEPIFAIAYKRRVIDTTLYEIHPYFLEVAKNMGFYSAELIEKVSKKGSLIGFKEVPLDVRRLFITAHGVPFKDHIEVQSAFQEFTDNAVSKTINLKQRTTRDDVAKAFVLAYEKGCKGITVFRYGSKRGPLIKFEEGD